MSEENESTESYNGLQKEKREKVIHNHWKQQFDVKDSTNVVSLNTSKTFFLFGFSIVFESSEKTI